MTLSLPARPSLDQLRKQAHELQRMAQSHGRVLSLADAYHELAKRYGFDSWPKLKRHVEFANDRPLRAIIEAIHVGDPDALRRLLAQHPERVTARAPNGDSLLHAATGGRTQTNEQRVEVIEVLLDAGLPVDTALDDGYTGLHFAAMYPDVARVACLLRHGASPDRSAGDDGGTPLVLALFYACRENAELLARHAVTPMNLRVAAGLGRTDLIEALWRPDGSLDPAAGQHRAWYRPHDGFPTWQPGDDPDEILGEAFMYAAMNNRLETVAYFLDRGIDIDIRPYRNATALHWAALRGQREAVELLLGRGANVDIRDEHHRGFPWGWAGEMGHIDLERLLIRHSKTLDIFNACNFDGSDVELVRRILDADPEVVHRRQNDPPSCGRQKRGTALHEAVDRYTPAKRDIIELLLARGADVDARTEDGKTPLIVAIGRGHAQAARLLLDHGADPNARDVTGRRSALHEAIEHCPDVVESLLEHGAEVDFAAAANLGRLDLLERMIEQDPALVQANPTGSPPLEWAAWGGHTDVARLLIKHGADPEAQGAHGPAIRMDHREMLRLLLDHTDNPAQLINTRRLLHSAVEMANTHDNRATVELLLARGADPGVRDDQDRTPLDLALELRRDPADPCGHVGPEVVAHWLDGVIDVLREAGSRTP